MAQTRSETKRNDPGQNRESANLENSLFFPVAFCFILCYSLFLAKGYTALKTNEALMDFECSQGKG